MDHPMALAIPQKVAQGSGRGRLASMEDLRFPTELTQPGGLRFPLLCLITGYHWYPIYWNILELDSGSFQLGRVQVMSEIPGEAGARNPPLMANRVEAVSK